MIRNEAEYQEAVLRVADERKRLKAQRAKLDELDLSQEEIKRVLDPMKSFHEQLKEEVASYERLQRGEFEELQNFGGLGRLLIALRISKGISQRELAERLGVHESQVSRDERNEYHGVTVERANRILEGLGAEVTTRVSSTGGGSPSGKRDRVFALAAVASFIARDGGRDNEGRRTEGWPPMWIRGFLKSIPFSAL